MKKLINIRSLAIIVILLAAFLAFCKKKETPPAGTTYSNNGSGGNTGDTSHTFPVTQVYVFNYHFSPPDISIAAGSSVSWTNRDSIAHTVTSRDGSFESGDLGPGKNFFVTFPNPGYHSYYCRYHKEGGNITVH